MGDVHTRRGARERAAQGDYAALAEFWTCFFDDRGAEIDGLRWVAEYGSADLAPWTPGAATWIVVAVRA